MKLTAVRINYFRGIHDSGWVFLDPLTGIVGENESGKTSFLLAISRLDLNSKFLPEDQSEEFSEENPVVSARFELEDLELKRLQQLVKTPNLAGDLTIVKDHRGRYSASLGAEELFTLANARKFKQGGPQEAAKIWEPTLEKRRNDLSSELQTFLSERRASLADGPVAALVEEVAEGLSIRYHTPKSQFDTLCKRLARLNSAGAMTPEEVDEWRNKYSQGLDQVVDAKTPCSEQLIAAMMPSFVYFNKYDVLESTYTEDELDKLPETSTIRKLLRLANIDHSDVFAAKDARRQQMQSKATALIRGLLTADWKQKQVEVTFRFGEEAGKKLLNLLVASGGATPVQFAQRSDGFKWFMSFYAAFNEANDDLEQVVLLLDDPAVSLHAKGQRDAYATFEKLVAKGNSLLFTTHSPFLVDLENLHRYRIAENVDEQHVGVKIRFPIRTEGELPIQPILTAMGCPVGCQFLTRSRFLIPEGPSDYFLLHAVIAAGAAKESPDQALGVMPALNAGMVRLLAAMCAAHDLAHVGLLDGDAQGAQLILTNVKSGLDSEVNLKSTTELFGVTHLEAVLPYDLYVEAVVLSNGAAQAKLAELEKAPADDDYKKHVRAIFAKYNLGDFSAIDTAAQLAAMFDPLRRGPDVAPEYRDRAADIIRRIKVQFGVPLDAGQKKAGAKKKK